MSTSKKTTKRNALVSARRVALEEKLLQLSVERAQVDIDDARFVLGKRRELADQLAALLPIVVKHYTSSAQGFTGSSLPLDLVMLAASLTPAQIEKLQEVLDADQFETVKRVLLGSVDRYPPPDPFTAPS